MKQAKSVYLLLFMISLLSTNTLIAQTEKLPFQDRLLPALLNKTVQVHLELTDKQNGKLKQLLADIQSKQKEFGAELKSFKTGGASPSQLEDKRSEMIGQLEKLKAEVQKEALDLLLPHQIIRLKQVTVQVMMRESAKKARTQSGLLTEEMIAFLEIDEKQQEQIRQKSKELQKKLLDEIKQLQKKYTKELLDELTAKQKKKYEEAVGDPIDR